MIRLCKTCGGALWEPANAQRYCSPECRKQARARVLPLFTHCLICGKPLGRSGESQGMRRYCSEDCQAEALRSVKLRYTRSAKGKATQHAKYLRQKQARAADVVSSALAQRSTQ